MFRIISWVFGVLLGIAGFLFLMILILSMLGVLGDMLGWWDGWVADG